MRASLQPLAHLVDAAAEKWVAVEDASTEEQLRVNQEITAAFRIGDRAELTFHGLRYLLSIIRDYDITADNSAAHTPEFRVEVHKIILNG